MRRSVLISAVLLALAFVLVGGPSLLISPTTSEVAPETEFDPEPELYRPTQGESGFWPYLNSREAFEKRSPINVVVIGETEEVLRVLTEVDDGEWEETDEEQEEADPGSLAGLEENETAPNGSLDDGSVIGTTATKWGMTTGASRYAYVDPGPGEAGRWVSETAQVHVGTYYGHRYHIRMYESPHPDERWVAMQTHSEHFDWFTLRHRVAGSQRAQMRLEADLMGLPQVNVDEDVTRVYLANGNASDADGWATFVDLAGLAAVGFVVSRRVAARTLHRAAVAIDARLTEADRQRIEAVRERIEVHHLLLVGTVIAVVMGVRLGGIGLEATGWLSMHAIAGLLYPVIALGLPGATYAIASRLERRLDAAITAGGALAVGIWLDYAFLGVDSLPIDVIAHRMLVVVALGLIAGGAARRAAHRTRLNDMLLVGALLWTVVLVGSLLGYF